ncbi:MAG: NAD dependent epimerase/dehydratase family [Candidatus Magasanikbacteria bacterium]|nr:NAD dependent epimerase/dehydratase family [Candidatus Magasanikbacteria bacterium]
MKRLLVTGSSGTIGTALSEALIKSGFEVIGVDRRKNIWSPAVQKRTIILDLLKPQLFKKLPPRVDLVIHLAAHARVYNLVKEPRLALENIATAFNVLEWARTHHVPRFLFASNSASKMSGEAMTHAYRQSYGMKTVIVRFSNVYGRYDESDRFVPLVTKKLLARQPITIFGKDKELDFTYIDDCVAGLLQLVKKFDTMNGRTFNLSSGETFRLIDVAKILGKLLGIKAVIKTAANRPGEVLKYCGDISPARRLFGFSPKFSLEKGMTAAAEWYKKLYK